MNTTQADKPTTTASAPETRTWRIVENDKSKDYCVIEYANGHRQQMLKRTIPAEKPTAHILAQVERNEAWIQLEEAEHQRDEARAHADKLAEALRVWEYAGNEGGISMVDWFEVARKKTREALAAYEAAQ